MTLKELLKMIRLEKIHQIAVSGPHCSGTQIGGYILAKELKTTYISEAAFGAMDFRKFCLATAGKESFVVQCPSLLYCAERFAPSVLIVLMNRPLEDILMSQRRVGWKDSVDRRPYDEFKVFDMNKPLAYIKYQYAEKYLARTRRVEYLDFESLDNHACFFSRDERRAFPAGQIAAKKDRPVIYFGRQKNAIKT